LSFIRVQLFQSRLFLFFLVASDLAVEVSKHSSDGSRRSERFSKEGRLWLSDDMLSVLLANTVDITLVVGCRARSSRLVSTFLFSQEELSFRLRLLLHLER